ncbi:MAG: peptidoglycan recognition protein family protein [Oscillospiraceae bacterium]|nr:peptidoglycan recognition protein family protein [Oscillospiraceae bacterium]
MKLYQLLLTKNECYQAGRPLAPKGIMVHSTGANNPKLSRYVGPDDGRLGANPAGNHWNQPRPEGRQICCHAFVGKLADGTVATYQVLPWNMRGWHCASGLNGSGNDTHIGFECCEDGLGNETYFRAVYEEATDLCAHLCKQFYLAAKDVVDHGEGHQKGIASHHEDIGHWLRRYGLTMNDFRARVQKKLGAQPTKENPEQPRPAPATPGAPFSGVFGLGDQVRLKAEAANYYPGGPDLKPWVKNGVFTLDRFMVINGVPCGRLQSINTWCSLDRLTLLR